MKKKIYLLLVILFIPSLLFSGWFQQQSNVTTNLRSVFFVNSNTGFAVGSSGTIIKTTNGGTNWFTLQSGVSQMLNSVYFSSTTTGWVCGTGGTIRKTTNGGTNWFTQYTGVTSALNMITFRLSNIGYVVGANGVALATINGGTNWSTVSINTTATLHSVFFPTLSYGWINGDNGTIWRTVNGGLNWSSQSSGLTSSLYGSYFFNESSGWIPTTAGNIIKTENGGTNWDLRYTGVNANYYSAYFINAYTGFVAGGNPTSIVGGVVCKTVNGGNNWYQQTIPSSLQILNCVKFVNSSTGWAVGNSGTIFKTTDCGLALPPAPVLIAPVNGATGVSLTPTLYWSLVPDANNYTVQVSQSSAFTTVVDSATLIGDYYTIPSGKLSPLTTYYWRVRAWNSLGYSPYSSVWNFTTMFLVGLTATGNEIPDNYELMQNYPNPFNSETTIKFKLPKQNYTELAVFDINGKENIRFIRNILPAGVYDLRLDASYLSSGVYFYTIKAGEFRDTKKMVIIK